MSRIFGEIFTCLYPQGPFNDRYQASHSRKCKCSICSLCVAECPSLLFSKAVQAVQRYVQTPNNFPHLQSDRVDSHSRSISNSRKWHIPIVLLHEHCPIYYTVLMKIYSIEFAKISVKGPFFFDFFCGVFLLRFSSRDLEKLWRLCRRSL